MIDYVKSKYNIFECKTINDCDIYVLYFDKNKIMKHNYTFIRKLERKI